MQKLIIVAFTALISFINTFAQVGNLSVKTWADDKKSAFSFTFDDGFISQYQTARPILNKYNFKGTFYLISGQMTETLPGNWRYGTWEQFREMAWEGHEIGSHTVTHPDLTTLSAGNKSTPGTIHYELFYSKFKIEENIPGIKIISAAYPYIAHNPQVDNITDLYYEGGRSGGNTLNNSTLTTSQRLGLFAKKVEFQLPRNSFEDDKDDLQNVKNYINSAVDHKKWAAIMIHEVYPQNKLASALSNSAYYPLTSEWLDSLCNWLQNKSWNNEVWIETAGNVLKYARERETFSSTVINVSDTLIEISVTDALDNSIYDFPLTADIIVPENWDTVYITQNGLSQMAIAFNNGSGKVVRSNIIPDKGNVILKRAGGSLQEFNISGNVTYADSTLNIPGVHVKLISNTGEITINTDIAGNFLFLNNAAGNFTIDFSKESNSNSVNATDALWALLYYTNSIDLDSMQILAADVTNDGNVNATDALQILRRFSGLIDSFEKPDWLFNPSPVEVELNYSDQALKIKAIIAGDVNKSFIP